MNLLLAAYTHCSRTMSPLQIILYVGWSLFLVLLSIDKSWLISGMVATIMLIAMPVCVYNDDQHDTRTRRIKHNC